MDKIDYKTLPPPVKNIDYKSLPAPVKNITPAAPVEEKGFLEKARETLGEVLFGAGSTKKAPEKPAALQFGEEDNLREIFLKNAAKQTFGSTPEELNDDISFAIKSPGMFHAVSNLADTHQKQFESVVKDKTKSWDVQSKELT